AIARERVNHVDRPSNAAAVLEGDRRVRSTGDAIDGTIGAVVEEHNPVAKLALGEWLAPAGADGTVTDDRLRRSIGVDRTNRPTLDVRDRRRLPGLRRHPAGGDDGGGATTL